MFTPSDVEKAVTHRVGYPDLTTWIARDPDNESYVFRKFDKLSARNLLNRQSRLISLERKLEQWDAEARASRDFDLRMSLQRWETFEAFAEDPQKPEHTRRKLENDLATELREYRKLSLLRRSWV
jgi:hypothetical protein